AARDNRLGYYGLGNDAPYFADSVRLAGAYFYRVSRTRLMARATVQRRLVGPIRILVGGTLARTNFRVLPGSSGFRRDRDTGAVGGYRSLRGYYDGRFAGPGKLIGGLEARYALLWIPSLVEVKLVAFYDAGRVFGPGEAVRLTTPASTAQVAPRSRCACCAIHS